MPKFATGGITPGGTILVGEKGPELLSPPAGSRITPTNKLSAGGGNTYVQVINNTPIEPVVEERPQANGDTLVRVLLNAVAKDITSNGPVGRAIDLTRGTRQIGVTR